GLMLKLSYATTGAPRAALVTDKDWKSAQEAPEGWHKPDFDDKKWQPVKVLGAVGKVGPWRVAEAQPGKQRFRVPDGFVIEEVVGPDPQSPDRMKVVENNKKSRDFGKPLPFSLVNMTFDDKGRLLVSQERGPVWLCTTPDRSGRLQNVRIYCDQVKNCQGM